MTRWSAFLLCMVLVGCSGAAPGIRYTAAQQERCVYLSIDRVALKGRNEAVYSARSAVEIVHVSAPAGALTATPLPPPSSVSLRALPGEALGDGIPRGVLRFAPASGAAAAVEAAPAAGELVFLGGAFIAAAGSTVLVCVTASAAAEGQKTPIEIADKYYDTRFGDIVGWVRSKYPSVSPSAAPKAESDKDEKKWRGRVYATYTKFNEKTKRYYSGRTSMVIDLTKDHLLQATLAVSLRDTNHHVDENVEPEDEEFLDAKLDKFDVGAALDYSQRYHDVAYRRIRGREQQLIDYFGGAWSDTGEPYRTENAVRGVAKDNEKGWQFHTEAREHWGELHPYTGY